MPAHVVKTDKAPAPLGPYSQAWIAGNLVFTAGQLGLAPGAKVLAEGIVEQTRQALRNIDCVLKAAGSSLERVVKTTVYLARLEDSAPMSGAYKGFFPSDPPARSTVQVAGLPMGALVEIEAVATLD